MNNFCPCFKLNWIVQNNFMVEASESMKEYWSKIQDNRTARNWSRVPTYSMLGKKHSEETKKKYSHDLMNLLCQLSAAGTSQC